MGWINKCERVVIGIVFSVSVAASAAVSLNEDCHYNKTQIKLQGKRCNRRCTVDKDCHNPGGKCICNGPCGWSCVNAGFCKYPGKIENGSVKLVGNMGFYEYTENTTNIGKDRVIVFDCQKDFVLVDGPESKTCLEGDWQPRGKNPRCISAQSVNNLFKIRRKRKAGAKAGSSVVQKKGYGGKGKARKAGSRKQKKLDGEDEEEDYDESEACPPLDHDPYIQIQVVQSGDDENQTFSAGAIVKVTCGFGFGVNLPNETIKCVAGDWKPKLPQCSPLPCEVPYLIHGTLFEKTKGLVFQDVVRHQVAIELKCTRGYVLKGPGRLVCWYGEWSFDDEPECVPAPCKLPSLNYGTYEKGYRSGMHLAHGTEVDFTCDGDFRKLSTGPSQCILGDFRPSKPACTHPSNIGGNSGHLEWDGGIPDKKKKDKDTNGNGIRRSCGSPPKERFAVAYIEGRPVDYSKDFSFMDGTDIQYRCIVVKPKVKNRWRTACTDGKWTTNTNVTCEEGNSTMEAEVAAELDEIMLMINGTCTYTSIDKYVATFYNEKQLIQDGVEFATGAQLTSRCVDIGKFRLKGSVRRKCYSGQWLGITPQCEGLSQFNDYKLGKPPTILFRYHNGSIIQSNDGKLLMHEGTTLHMECLWIRKFGSPKWETSNTHRVYQEGWTDDPGRDSMLEYRLTIDNAQVNDTGTYRCSTPARYSHEINIEVKSINCPELPQRDDLVYSQNANSLGAVVKIQCRGGNSSVVGAEEVICLPSGEWSTGLPKCENVQCQDISLLPAFAPMPSVKGNPFKKNETAPPKISIESFDVGGKAIFSCPQGFITEGASEAVCMSTGKWSTAVPHCKELECPQPNAPENGFVAGKPPYRAGDLAQFECQNGYMMEGQPIVACQDNGKWSRAAGIKCVVSCPYPGTTIGGTISQVKFYYAIGETVEFDCTDEYELQGTRMLHCQKNGKWSNTVPTCYSKHGGSSNYGVVAHNKNKPRM